MSLYSMLRGNGPSGFGYGSTAEEVSSGLDLTGKTVLITGVNSGIGEESARVFALRGARIVAAARTEAKGRDACAGLATEVIPVACELSDPKSVQDVVARVRAQVEQIDVILCNAGIMALPERNVEHGQELQFLTNHLGHFMLVTGLMDKLADDGRVVMVSSAAHNWAPSGGIQFDDISMERNYSAAKAYGQSKLANLLFAKALAKRLRGKQTANAVHPGVIATNLARHMNPLVRALMPLGTALAMKSIPQGAATQVFVATHPSLRDVSGEYFADCNRAKSSRHGRDEALAERLWSESEKIVAAF